MFTAFNYYEPEEENRVRKEIKDSKFFEKELDIARQFVEEHKQLVTKKIDCCPICKCSNISLFYKKWDIDYLRCNQCYSIFADVDEQMVHRYKSLDDMINLRISEDYQEKASASRNQIWNELFDWLKFRTFRYLERNQGLSIIDYGTRYYGLKELLQCSDMCEKYELRKSILNLKETDLNNNTLIQADVVLCLDCIQQEIDPIDYLQSIKQHLKQKGLLFLSTRVGSGFDILTLRENNTNVFPYEHIMMPTKEGLKIMLEQAGFEMLEFTTPGTFDWNYVKANSTKLSTNEYFLRYFMDTATPHMEAEFQRFLQQSGMSSYAQVVARLL